MEDSICYVDEDTMEKDSSEDEENTTSSSDTSQDYPYNKSIQEKQVEVQEETVDIIIKCTGCQKVFPFKASKGKKSENEIHPTACPDCSQPKPKKTNKGKGKQSANESRTSNKSKNSCYVSKACFNQEFRKDVPMQKIKDFVRIGKKRNYNHGQRTSKIHADACFVCNTAIRQITVAITVFPAAKTFKISGHKDLVQGLLGKMGNLESVVEGVISKVAEEKTVLDEEIDQDQAEMTDKQVMDKYDRNYVDLNICLFSEGPFSRLDTSTSKLAQAMLYAMYQAEACKQGRGNDFLFKKKLD